MNQPNGRANEGLNETLYEQVLDFARKEIEDASSQMDELRHALHLVEARVEAAKSVYESVAVRLNLEEELEDEARLSSTPLPGISGQPRQGPPTDASDQLPQDYTPPIQVPQTETEPAIAPLPAFVPEPEPELPAPIAQAPIQPPVMPEPPAPIAPPPAPPIIASRPPAPEPQAPDPVPFAPEAPVSQGNGSSDGFGMDLIRKHLEAREKAAGVASQAPTRRPEPPSEAPPPFVQAAAPPAESESAPEPSAETQPAQGGFPGLSEADRALIGEYLRSKRD